MALARHRAEALATHRAVALATHRAVALDTHQYLVGAADARCVVKVP